MRPYFGLLWRLVWCVAVGAAARAEVARTERPPNIVLILADDLGYGDLGCYGSPTIATPHLDRMAKEGVRLTSCYAAAPFCSPSRAALLTGRLPARCGVPYVLFPAEHHGLPEAEITLAEWLRERGYATACIGKWHLGADAPFHPQRHGFDLFFGVPYSNDSLEWPLGEPFQQVMGLEPLPLLEGAQLVEAPVDQSLLTRRYTERAVQFLREHRDRPLLLYLAHTMPHIPQYASPEFAGRSRGGLYGDVVEELDWSTGVILETLRELHLAEQTLVVFTSDNGAPVRRPAAQPSARPPRGERFPGRSLTGSNGPLRGGKGQTWEGGVRVPCLVWLPGTIPAGRVLEAPVSLMDLFPTAAALAGAPLPGDRVFDGRNIAPLLAGEPLEAHEPRWIPDYFGYQLQAVRSGDWKLLVEVHTRPQPRPVSLWYDHQPQLFETQHRLLARAELYDLSRDVGESTDLAAAHPEVVARLAAEARAFDAALQADCRPLEFAPGPPPPPPRTIRTAETDLTPWRRFHLPVPVRSAAP